MKKALIIGGGFTGFTWAHLLAKKGWQVEILEKDVRPGGGIKTLWYNGHPYTHGPRHFVGKSDKAFSFIKGMIPQREFRFSAKTYVARDDRFYIYPPHEDDVDTMPDAELVRREMREAKKNAAGSPLNFEDKWVGGIGETLYRKFVDGYTRKHWQIPSNTLIDEVTYIGSLSGEYAQLRTGSREMLPGSYISYPVGINGWDDYFHRIASEKGVRVRYGVSITAFDLEKRELHVGDEVVTGDIIVNTLSPDVICEQAWGALPYIGRRLMMQLLPRETVFPDDVIFVYYAGDEPELRMVEYKKFTGHQSPYSLIGIEYAVPGRQDYPMPFIREVERAKRYINSLPKDVISVGRLGSYRYMTMSDIIDQAMDGVENY